MDVFEVEAVLRVQIHRAVQPRFHPVILVFDIGTGGPADADHRQIVDAGAHLRREIELRGQTRIGRHADEFSVQVNPRHRFRRADVEHRAALEPGRSQFERSPVHACGIFLGHDRRLVLKGHLDIRVVRMRVALRAEIARDLDFVPFRGVGIIGDFGRRDVFRLFVVGERPLPVEQFIPRGLGGLEVQRLFLRRVRNQIRPGPEPIHRSQFRNFPGARKQCTVQLHGDDVIGCSGERCGLLYQSRQGGGRGETHEFPMNEHFFSEWEPELGRGFLPPAAARKTKAARGHGTRRRGTDRTEPPSGKSAYRIFFISNDLPRRASRANSPQ